ncbi:MAG: hypothetical protein IJR97_06380 [Clostridia bacterium]|nr:hypothetical protein [Clostridia bacterium]
MKKIISLILLVLLCVDTVITCAEPANDEKKQYDLFSFAHLQSHKFQELMDEIVAQSETWTSETVPTSIDKLVYYPEVLFPLAECRYNMDPKMEISRKGTVYTVKTDIADVLEKANVVLERNWGGYYYVYIGAEQKEGGRRAGMVEETGEPYTYTGDAAELWYDYKTLNVGTGVGIVYIRNKYPWTWSVSISKNKKRFDWPKSVEMNLQSPDVQITWGYDYRTQTFMQQVMITNKAKGHGSIVFWDLKNGTVKRYHDQGDYLIDAYVGRRPEPEYD